MADEFVTPDAADPFDAQDVARSNTAQEERKRAATTTVLDYLRSRQEAYKRFFNGTPQPGDAEMVLADLYAFCRGDDTTFHPNERIHTLLTGRQEVILRINDHRRLSFDALVAKYTTPPKES